MRQTYDKPTSPPTPALILASGSSTQPINVPKSPTKSVYFSTPATETQVPSLPLIHSASISLIKLEHSPIIDTEPPCLSGPFPASTSTLRYSSRSTKGTRASTRYVDEAYFSYVSHGTDVCSTVSSLTYTSKLHTDLDTGEVSCDGPRAYTEKF